MGACSVNRFSYSPIRHGIPQDMVHVVQITYNGIGHVFRTDSEGRIPYHVLNATIGWENPWISNGQTYQAFLGSHTVFGTPWHHSSAIIFALPDCPQFGGAEHFDNSFSNVIYATIGGGASPGIVNLTGEFNRPSDVRLDNKCEMIALGINAEIIRGLIRNTEIFGTERNITYVFFPELRGAQGFNSGSFMAGLFLSLEITTTPTPNSPGWATPVSLCHFEND